MRTLSNLDLLELWERGSSLHPLDRALLTLATALPAEPYQSLAEWPLGRRNAALAQLRRSCFGKTLEGWTTCPQCGQRLEFAMDAASLIEQSVPPTEPLTLNGHSFRPLTSRDLAAVTRQRDPRAAALSLLRQCCLDEDLSTDGLTDHELESIGNQIAEADPLSETVLTLHCVDCGHQWDESLDIASWLWTEIEARARHLLADIHTLASAYGWSEAEILSLSGARRALYLEMVQS
jgi:hypothetical protein